MASDHWGSYLLSRNSASSCGESLREQIDNLGHCVFSPTTSNVEIIDLKGDKEDYLLVTDEHEFGEAICKIPRFKRRIISIYSPRTIAPLNITSKLAAAIFQAYDVKEDFLRVLLSFGDEPHQSEASSSNKSYVASTDGSYVLTYKLNYVEKNKRGGKDPWSFRHVGIYHEHKRDQDLIIILHCTSASSLSLRLSKRLDDDPSTIHPNEVLKTFYLHPETIHSLVLACYIDNWRLYLRHLGDQFSKINNSAMIETAEGTGQESFLRVQELRNTIDFAIFSNAGCTSNLDVIEFLTRIPRFDSEGCQDLSTMSGVLQGFISSSKVLQDRIRNTIDLIGYTLSLHNQQELRNLAQETGEVTKGLKDLTENTVDDSAIVRIITIVSAFYLPGSFVATIFGMNFFVFDEQGRQIVISRDFWVFVVVWAVLTLFTAGMFYLTYLRNSSKKGKSHKSGQIRLPEKV